MACFRPIHGFVSKTVNPNGKRNTVFRIQQAQYTERDGGYGPIRRQMPCGQCIGCRLEYSRQWAMRILHEASLHENNCFITLTYRPENLPHNNQLVKKDFQDFMKRLRKNTNIKIRFYHCGEYGENFKRPHYHACLFGINFTDGKPVYKRDDITLYDSPQLEKIWQHGFVSVGELTFESAAYVARYVTKKINGKKKEQHYEILDETTGELTQRTQEYATMSRRPGIATNWIETYTSDCYPKDYVTLRGKTMRPPKFYDRHLEKTHKIMFDKVKKKRDKQVQELKTHIDYSDPRLLVREKCKILTAQLLKRGLEDDTQDVLDL